ncbi:MAG: DUF1801 domain-containing protein [Candidatus Bathyarchaeota archaeon]
MSIDIQNYIVEQKSPQKEILQKIRKIFQKTLPNCKEEMRWGVITFADGKFYIAAMKNRVHVGFAIKGLNENEISLFEGSGKTMKHIKILTLEDIKEKNIVKLIELVNKKTICNQF